MECTQEGEIVRAKELNMSFTIPKKRKISESNGGDEVNDDKNKSEIGQKSVVNDAYEQNGNDKPKSYMPWPESLQSAESYSKLYQYYQQGYGTGDVKGLKVFTSRESPQPKLTTTYRDTFGDLTDSTLPKELKEQFQPLFCKLCSMQLGSTVNAKMHYYSKNHEKKVRNFLIEYSKRTGEPLHKKAKKQTEDEDHNPRHYHCDVCDLPLTGRVHAESHYMGKNHQKVLSGRKAPAGKGHYNEEGKFVRDLSVSSTNSTTRDGFGLDFLDKTACAAAAEGAPESAKSLRCDLCNVSVTSYPQMDMHLQGQKHKKRCVQVVSYLKCLQCQMREVRHHQHYTHRTERRVANTTVRPAISHSTQSHSSRRTCIVKTMPRKQMPQPESELFMIFKLSE